jgi:hypothetical protein
MQVKYKSHQEEITEEGTYTLGDTITITLDCTTAAGLYVTTLPDGTVLRLNSGTIDTTG